MTTVIVHPGHRGTAKRTMFGFVTDDYPMLHKVQNAISAICALFAGLAIVLSGALTILEVFMRSVLSKPLGWNIGFSERYLMVAIAFFGLVTAYRSGAHIAVASLFGKFPKRMQKVLMLVAQTIVAAIFLTLFISGWQTTAFSISINEQIPPGMAELPWPSWTWKAMVPLGSFFGLVVTMIDIFRELTTSWSVPATDYEPGEGV
ncbi:TRAP transporter small permease [Corynebacterium sp. H113]|uniref:TRAP transporter small permease n=1 Tax=Corynebacterium sp. H113 TaxID=3133419 RepID=UPI00309F2774